MSIESEARDGRGSHRDKPLRSRTAEIDEIVKALSGLKFGVVSIIVQDGVIVQIERTEKYRVAKTKNLQSTKDSSGE